jgi:predicted TIM-barrel fold metal-dependent hydrolase
MLAPSEVIALMDEAGVDQICLSAWHRPSGPIFTNDEVTQYTRAYPKRIFGLATVNLLDPVAAVKELDHYVRVEGFRGLRIAPWLWDLPPTDAHYWPLYVKCIELDIPFMTQVGHTGPLCPSEPGRPIPYIDTIALKFPQLKIVCGHIGHPWTAEMIAVAWKHENVYIDTSAHSPKYYPAELIHFANTTGKDKVMFGTNFPQLQWKDCVVNVGKHIAPKMKEDVLQNFMGLNARKVLKLEPLDSQKVKSAL